MNIVTYTIEGHDCPNNMSIEVYKKYLVGMIMLSELRKQTIYVCSQ